MDKTVENDGVLMVLDQVVIDGLNDLSGGECEHSKDTKGNPARKYKCPICVGERMQETFDTAVIIGFVKGAKHWAKGEGKVLTNEEVQAVANVAIEMIAKGISQASNSGGESNVIDELIEEVFNFNKKEVN